MAIIVILKLTIADKKIAAMGIYIYISFILFTQFYDIGSICNLSKIIIFVIQQLCEMYFFT